MPQASCASCRHFQPTSDRDGFCHRFPPIAFLAADEIRSAWPPVKPQSLCGEWAAAVLRVDETLALEPRPPSPAGYSPIV